MTMTLTLSKPKPRFSSPALERSVLLLPLPVLLLIFYVLPFLGVVGWSFSLPTPGIEQYERIATDPAIHEMLWRTLRLCLTVSCLALLIGYLLAYCWVFSPPFWQRVVEICIFIPFWISVLLGGGVVVIYSAIGGMWSLTLTDIVQFIIKTVGLMFILLPICLYRVGGWDELVLKLPAAAFNFTTIGWDTIITYFMIYFFGILIGQDIWQRVFTVRTPKVAQYAGTLAGFYCILYGLACALIGMAAHVLIPDLDNVNNAFAAIVKLSLPDGIRGLVIAAALAAMMSTASAGLLAAATTLTEDLLPKLRGGKQSSLGVNRLFTLLTGVVVLGIALVVNDVISALTLAYNLLVGGMLIPLIGAIFWKRATTAGAIASMSLGFATALLFMFKDGLDANTPIYYSLAVGLVSFVVVSLLSRRPVRSSSAITASESAIWGTFAGLTKLAALNHARAPARCPQSRRPLPPARPPKAVHSLRPCC